MPTFEEIASRFGDLQKRTTTGVMVRCPAHDDTNPSLILIRGDSGVGLCCYAGCENSSILDAAGMGWPDMFYEPLPEHRNEGFQPELVLEDRYDYLRTDGSLHMVVEKWVKPNGSKTFRQRDAEGNYKLGVGFKPCLFNLDQVIPHCQQGGEVWITEGEKDVRTLLHHGLMATTAPMGAGKWRSYYSRWLAGARRVVVVADNDEPGRKHAALISDDLVAKGFDVQCVRARQGKDATDHFRWGHTAADFTPFNPHRTRPQGITHAQLMGKKFPPVTWSVPGILSAGLALLGGPPKQGKSWTALDLALAVASGGYSRLGPGGLAGDVLYLALDNDTESRLQQRTHYVLNDVARIGEQCPDQLPIEFHVEWPTGIDAVAAVRDWMREAPAPKLAVIDTLVKVEPEFDSPNYGAYSHSTDVLSRWAQLAIEGNITILAVHHDRKGGLVEDGDWIDRFTGSRGITATASTLLFLDVKRGSDEGKLHMTGRDVGDYSIPLQHHGTLWQGHNLPVGVKSCVPDTIEELEQELGASAAEPTYNGLSVVPDVQPELEPPI